MYKILFFTCFAAIFLFFSQHANAGELTGDARSEWWSDEFTGFNADISVKPVPDENGRFRLAAAWFFPAGGSPATGPLSIKYAEFDGTSWVVENAVNIPVDAIPGVDETQHPTALSLAFKPNGSPGIAFGWRAFAGLTQQQKYFAHHIEKASGAWQFTSGSLGAIFTHGPVTIECGSSLDNFGVHAIDLAYTTTGVACIVLRRLFYEKIGTQCVTVDAVEYSENRTTSQVVANGQRGGYGACSIAMNTSITSPLLQPVIAFDAPAATANDWRFRTKSGAGNSWNAADVIVGQFPDIAILPNGTPIAAFKGGVNGYTLFFGKKVSGSWQSAQIATGNVGYRTAVNFNPLNSNPSILGPANVLYTFNPTSNSWVNMGDVVKVDSNNSHYTGFMLDLVMDPVSGQPYTLAEDEYYTAVIGRKKCLQVELQSNNGVNLGTVLNMCSLFDSGGNLVPFDPHFSSSTSAPPSFKYTNLPVGTYTLYVDAFNHKLQYKTITLTETSMQRDIFVLEYCPNNCW